MGASVAGVCNAVTPNGDACAVGIAFMWVYFTDNTGISDIVAAEWGNLMEVYGLEGVGACNAWGARVHGALANALAEASQFIGLVGNVGFVSCRRTPI